MAQPAYRYDWADDLDDDWDTAQPERPDPFAEAVLRIITSHRWTEAHLAHLPKEYRYEIIDGRLLVTPPASEDHQDWCSWAYDALRPVAPDGWRVRWDIGLRLGEDLFIPDLVVLPPEAPRANRAYNPVTPALVVEVESRSTRSVDRVDKLEKYQSGIGGYWRVERDGTVNIYRLDGESYGEPVVLKPGETAELEYPYPVSVTVPSR